MDAVGGGGGHTPVETTEGWIHGSAGIHHRPALGSEVARRGEGGLGRGLFRHSGRSFRWVWAWFSCFYHCDCDAGCCWSYLPSFWGLANDANTSVALLLSMFLIL